MTKPRALGSEATRRLTAAIRRLDEARSILRLLDAESLTMAQQVYSARLRAIVADAQAELACIPRNGNGHEVKQ